MYTRGAKKCERTVAAASDVTHLDECSALSISAAQQWPCQSRKLKNPLNYIKHKTAPKTAPLCYLFIHFCHISSNAF